jgi:hypothetical protein
MPVTTPEQEVLEKITEAPEVYAVLTRGPGNETHYYQKADGIWIEYDGFTLGPLWAAFDNLQ